MEQQKHSDMQNLAIQDWQTNNPTENSRPVASIAKSETPKSTKTPSFGRIVIELVLAVLWGFAASYLVLQLALLAVITDGVAASPGQKQLSVVLLLVALVIFLITARYTYTKSMRSRGY